MRRKGIAAGGLRRSLLCLPAEGEQQLRESLGRLDLGTVADSLQQLEPRTWDRRQDALRAAVEYEPVAIAPHQKHRHRDPFGLKCLPQLRDQPMGDVQVARYVRPPAVVPGKGGDDLGIDLSRGGEREL